MLRLPSMIKFNHEDSSLSHEAGRPVACARFLSDQLYDVKTRYPNNIHKAFASYGRVQQCLTIA